MINWRNHPWENIYAKRGRPYRELFPGFPEVMRIFREKKCSCILDLGCGTGRYAVHLAKAGFSVLGADISLTGLKLARDWIQDEKLNVPLVHIDMRMGLPFASAKFDGVFSAQVIHHATLAEIRRTIKDIHRIMQPGGIAFIGVAGRLEDGEPFKEIEPATYVPQTGSEAGLPHHIFTDHDLQFEFRAFDILEITYRGGGIVLAIWIKKRIE